jgi:hypothetical protein
MLAMLMMAAVVANDAKAPDTCLKIEPDMAVAAERQASFKRLGDLPPAAHVLTVFRRIDGCVTPVVLRNGIEAGMTIAPAQE